MGTLYVLQNKLNKKCYVGQTIHTADLRFKQHIREGRVIGYAIKKYGEEGFNKHVYNEIPEELLDYFEIEMIKHLNSIVPMGYNLDSGGNKNKHFSEESKKKMSRSRMGDKNPMFGKYPFLGKHHSEEHKKHMSDRNKGTGNAWFGKKHSKETKLKMSNSHIGNKSMLGKKHTEETRRKMSASRLAYCNRKLRHSGIV
jgi:group I intron endonuclease